MSTQFDRAEDALMYGVAMAGGDHKTTVLAEDAQLRVQSMMAALVEMSDMNPTHVEESRKAWEEQEKGQKGYRFINKNGLEVGIVVAPFRQGFCVWGIDLQSGHAFRM